MKHFSIIITACIILFFTACGGGGGSSESNPSIDKTLSSSSVETPSSFSSSSSSSTQAQEESANPYPLAQEGVISYVETKTLPSYQESGVTIIDVRTPAEWADTGVIPGSHLLTSHGESGFDADVFIASLKSMGLDEESTVGFICRSGNRSKEVAEALNSRGFKYIYSFTGGITEYEYKYGLPLEPYQ